MATSIATLPDALRALTSLSLRLLAVGGKFVAILALAREGGAEEVGEFGVFFAAINVCVYVIGVDFHLFTIRELLARRSLPARLRVINGQAAFDALIYAVVLSVGLVLYLWGAWRFEGVPVMWFVGILVADHIAQEFSRLFLVMRRPHAANILYAVKTGVWGWIGAAGMYVGWIAAEARTFYLLWLCADVATIVVGFLLALRLFEGVRPSVPRNLVAWTRRGVGISWQFYLTSVSTMLLAYVDRFVIARGVSISDAGLYTFWQSVAGLVPVAVYAMIGMHALPVLVEAYSRGRVAEFGVRRRQFLLGTIAVAVVAAALIVVSAPYILLLTGESDFRMDRMLVVLLTLTACANSLWQVPYQVLYSASDDRFLAVAIVSITAAAVLINVLAVQLWGVVGAATAALGANVVMFVVLDKRARRHCRAVSGERRSAATA